MAANGVLASTSSLREICQSAASSKYSRNPKEMAVVIGCRPRANAKPLPQRALSELLDRVR